MRIAIVGQHYDGYGRGRENSVGLCTCEISRALACLGVNVRVYGVGAAGEVAQCYKDEDGIEYRIFRKRLPDALLYKLVTRLGPIGRMFNHGMDIAPSTSSLTYPGYGREVARDLAVDPVDLILLQHNARRIVPIRNAGVKAPIIVHLHAPLFPQELTQGYCRALLDAEAVTGVSEYVALEAEKILGRHCGVIRNGVHEDAPAAQETQCDTGAPPHVLYAGAVSPEKGVHILIDAFVRVLKRHPNARLDIIGGGARPFSVVFPQRDDPFIGEVRPFFKGDYRSMLEDRIPPEARSSICFVGHLSRDVLLARMAAAQVFAFPSIWQEGFGLPPIEAMAMGIAVVVSDGGALPSIVDGGKAGLVVPRNDVDGLANALDKLLSDHRRRREVAAAGQKYVKRTFTWAHAAQDLLSVAREIQAGVGGRTAQAGATV